MSFNTSRLPTRSNRRAPNRLSRSCKAALVADWERATLRADSSVLITASGGERTEVGRELGDQFLLDGSPMEEATAGFFNAKTLSLLTAHSFLAKG